MTSPIPTDPSALAALMDDSEGTELYDQLAAQEGDAAPEIWSIACATYARAHVEGKQSTAHAKIPLADPRVLALARARQQLAHEGMLLPTWGELTPAEQEQSLPSARSYLEAAVRAGLVGPATPCSCGAEPVHMHGCQQP